MVEYQKRITDHINHVCDTQSELLSTAAKWVAEALISNRIIHTFGTGHSHMIGLELFVRAGGLANVNAFLDSTSMTIEGARRSASIERVEGMAQVLWDQYTIDPEDIMILISNSGRNAMPIEMAMIAKEHGLKTIGITSLQQSRCGC